jgi:hypothetical protein
MQMASASYLGLIMDKKLTFRDPREYFTDEVSRLIKIYYPFINRKFRLIRTVKLTLYRTIFISALQYATPVWSGCAASHKSNLQVKQNTILKMILNKPWYYVARMMSFGTLDDSVSRTSELIFRQE